MDLMKKILFNFSLSSLPSHIPLLFSNTMAAFPGPATSGLTRWVVGRPVLSTSLRSIKEDLSGLSLFSTELDIEEAEMNICSGTH